MTIYVMRRLLLPIPVLLLSSLVVFGLMRIMPGDALTALMAESGNGSPREMQKLCKDLGKLSDRFSCWVLHFPLTLSHTLWHIGLILL